MSFEVEVKNIKLYNLQNNFNFPLRVGMPK